MTAGFRSYISGVTDTRPVWTPTPTEVASANVTRFIRDVIQPFGGTASAVHDAHSLYDWSIAEPERFWPAVWRFCGIRAADLGGRQWDEVLVGGDRVAPPDPVRGPRWFTGARLNFAENLLVRRDSADALVMWTEQGRGRVLSFAELARDVARFAAFLREEGVGIGDRVAGFLPNIPEAVVAMLATASVGAARSCGTPGSRA